MSRSYDELASPNRIEVLAKFAKFYVHTTRSGDAHQLYFFSKHYVHCTSMLIFGGNVYRQRGGWCWMTGKRKSLVGLYKLLESFDGEINESVQRFIIWVRTTIYMEGPTE